MNLKSFYLRKKYWINDFFHGSPMFKEFQDISKMNQNLSYAYRKRDLYLKNILTYAQANVPFYSQIKGTNLEDFPVINKLTILNNQEMFKLPYEKIPQQKGNLHIHHTSGSTGIPFTFPQDSKCRMRRIATIKYYNDTIGFHSFDSLAHIRSLSQYYNDDRQIIYRPDLNITYINNNNLDEKSTQLMIDTIIQRKIRFIRGYMSSIDHITKFIINNGIQLPIRPFFISVGEPLLESLRDRIINQLHCNIISQYASEEFGIIGQTDINGKGDTMNINRGIILEVLKMNEDKPAEDGEQGRLVITDLTNYALPFIRYEIGDVAAVSKRSGTIIEQITQLTGRKTDLIYNPEGTPIDIINSIPSEIIHNKNISQWQFIQHTTNSYTLKLVLKDNSLLKQESIFIQYMKNILGENAHIKIDFTNEIPILRSGKRKLVINENN